MKTVPSSGKSAGFANVAGFIAAFYLHGSLSILGISILLTQSAQLFFIVKMMGALYLIWIGIKALKEAFSETKTSPAPKVNKPKTRFYKAFLEGFLTNALNPKVSMFYLAAFPQFIPTGEAAISQAFLLVGIHSVMNMLWFCGMVIVFARLSQVAKSPRFSRCLKGFTGLVFVGFGAKLMSLKVD